MGEERKNETRDVTCSDGASESIPKSDDAVSVPIGLAYYLVLRLVSNGNEKWLEDLHKSSYFYPVSTFQKYVAVPSFLLAAIPLSRVSFPQIWKQGKVFVTFPSGVDELVR